MHNCQKSVLLRKVAQAALSFPKGDCSGFDPAKGKSVNIHRAGCKKKVALQLAPKTAISVFWGGFSSGLLYQERISPVHRSSQHLSLMALMSTALVANLSNLLGVGASGGLFQAWGILMVFGLQVVQE